MRAVTRRRYGTPDVLRVENVETPQPEEGELLVRVRAVSLNPMDWHFLRGKPLVMRLPLNLFSPKRRILGADMAGVVEAVGAGATRFAPGDAVFGLVPGMGGLAEYVTVPENRLLSVPEGVSFEEASTAPIPGVTALQGLRAGGGIADGGRVLVNGASGGVGTWAVQIAKAWRAEVTGVCSTDPEMVLGIGADRVVDYQKEDFTRTGERYDLVLDTVGNRSLAHVERALTPAGTYVAVAGPLLRAIRLSVFGGERTAFVFAKPEMEDLATLRGFLADGAVRPVIDRTYPLDEAADALRYVGAGHVQGKVVVIP